jgi:hypothetical protein
MGSPETLAQSGFQRIARVALLLKQHLFYLATLDRSVAASYLSFFLSWNQKLDYL